MGASHTLNRRARTQHEIPRWSSVSISVSLSQILHQTILLVVWREERDREIYSALAATNESSFFGVYFQNRPVRMTLYYLQTN